MVDIGIAHGRFQLFHLDHLKYVLAAKERCRRLVVGITNPDPTLTKFDQADPHRSLETDNPLTFYERFVILREALLETGLDFSPSISPNSTAITCPWTPPSFSPFTMTGESANSPCLRRWA
jgi:nicotinamide mononucleotide adenylyltransferase